MGMTVKELWAQLGELGNMWSNEENGRSIYYGIMEKKPDNSVDVASGGRGEVEHMLRAMAEQIVRFGKYAGQPEKVALLFISDLIEKLLKDIGEELGKDGDPDATEA